MLLCKELIMVEGSQCIISWHMTTFLCSLGVVAGVVCCDSPSQGNITVLFSGLTIAVYVILLLCMLFLLSFCFSMASVREFKLVSCFVFTDQWLHDINIGDFFLLLFVDSLLLSA